jgi:hypothetical protein
MTARIARRRRTLAGLLSAAALVWPGSTKGAAALNPQEPDLSVEAVVRAAAAWLEQYRNDVAFLLADETYVQSRQSRAGRELEHRSMSGELFLTYVAADDDWIAVHDVQAVDDVPVGDREGLQDLLRRGGTLRGIARLVAERNAGFNIGGVWRNFNEPLFPLQLLEPDRVSRVRFTAKSVTRGGEIPLVTVEFEERGRPTLVRTPEGPVAARGEMTIEAGSGRVRRTRFELHRGALRADLVTEYAHDLKMDMWLPSTFAERYEGERDGDREVIVAHATYTNYRRFTATGRIKR